MNVMGNFFVKVFAVALVFAFAGWWGVGEVSAATVYVNIKASGPAGAFDPDNVTINTGDTVQWTALGDDHQISSDQHPSHGEYPDPPCPNASCLDSPTLFTGNTFSFTFKAGGTWNYHNHKLPGRTGSVIVNDLNSPATTTNLAASNPTGNAVTLTWTSPGDDVGSSGNILTPTSYDVRYSTSPITSANWSSATQGTSEPTPLVAGSSQSMTVTGLTQLTGYYFALKTSDEVPNVSPLSNLTSATTTVADNSPPAAVTNLAASEATDASMKLTWTAPGDDGASGTASIYDIRYSTANITDANWSSATQVTGEPTPQVAGTSQSMTVSGLTLATLYYFAMKTSDEQPNESGLSNVVSGTTVARSTVRVRVTDFTYPGTVSDLSSKVVSATSVELTWTAPGDDGFSGTSTAYDIRYSSEKDFVLQEGTWSFARIVARPPIPGRAGTSQSFVVSVLEPFELYYFGVKALDEVPNYSLVSNIASSRMILTETIPPSPISDLTFTNPSISAAALSWTAPGDDGLAGTSTSYDIRYIKGAESLSEENWFSAISFLNPPKPQAAGAGETFAIVGFDHETTYSIGIKAVDDAGNRSSLSNVISFTTPPVPKDTGESAASSTISEGDLVRPKDGLTISLIIGGKRLWIPSEAAFASAGYEWSDVREVSLEDIYTIESARLLRVKDTAEVYEILHDKKRHIPSAEAFVNEGNSWDDIVIVSDLAISWYKVASLLRAVGEQKVYRIYEGLVSLGDIPGKRWIETAEAFTKAGYDWNDVVSVSAISLEGYQTGEALGEERIHAVALDQEGFYPRVLSVKAGDVVSFFNIGTGARWPASDVHPDHKEYPGLDPRSPIAPGENWSFPFERLGEWGMHDHIDPTLAGRIVVTGNE